MSEQKYYVERVARAQKKYGQSLRQFKFSLSRDRDAGLIEQLEALPNLKGWIINKLRKESSMKIKVVKVPGGRRLIKGKYVDMLDLDYTQDLAELQKDIDVAMPALLKNLSIIDDLTVSGKIVVHRGSNHIDVALDGKGSLGWLMIEHYIDEPEED